MYWGVPIITSADRVELAAHARQAEVRQVDLAFRRQQDVRGFDVAVEHPSLVRVGQGRTGGLDDMQPFGPRERSLS